MYIFKVLAIAIYTFYHHFLHIVYLCNMISELHLPEPILFNPLKHHLGFIREFVRMIPEDHNTTDQKDIIRELKHIGTSVMDVYTGVLQVNDICKEVISHVKEKGFSTREIFSDWTGKGMKDFRIIQLSDGSQWTLKYHENCLRYLHIFPARGSMHSFRVKSNTLKSALLYYILVGKDFITGDDLNKVRPLLGLSPVRDPVDAKAITEMIEILRTGE
jgi:hypothetical protein